MEHRVIARPRLSAGLLAGGQRLLVFAAPTGYGKTTLARSWLEELGATRPTLWVQFTAGLSSLAEAWATVVHSAHIAGALDQAAVAGLIAELAEAEHPGKPVGAMLARLGPAPMIVLDSYEHGRALGAALDDQIAALVEQHPGLTLLITTHGPTTLTDPVRQMRLETTVLGPEQLCFTEAETEAFLNAHEQEPHPDRVRRVHALTHGYPLALRALALAGPTGSTHGADWRSLVARDLQRRLPEELRELVTATAVAPYVDAELAGLLTGSADVADQLAELEWHGIGRWVPYAPDRPAYHYIEVFRDAVAADLRTAAPERYRALAATAAQWLSREGEGHEALRLAVETGHYALASGIYRNLVADRPESHAVTDLNELLHRLPLTTLRQYPVLAFARGVSAMGSSATQVAGLECLAIAAERLTVDLAGLTETDILIHHTMRALAMRLIGQSIESGQAAAHALDYFQRHFDAFDHSRLVMVRPLALRHLAYSLFQTGNVDRALDTVGRALTHAPDAWSRKVSLSFSAGMSAVEGRRREAQEALDAQDALDPAGGTGIERSYVTTLSKLAEATLRLDDFDFTGALATYEGVESSLDSVEPWPMITWTIMLARLGLGEQAAEAHRVDTMLAQRPRPLGVGPNLATAMLRGTLATLWLAAGRRNRSQELLRARVNHPGQLAPAILLHRMLGDPANAVAAIPALEHARGHTVRSTIHLLTLGAVAALRADLSDPAEGLLTRASALYAVHGARAHLITIPAEDLAALRGLAARGADPAALSYLDGEIPSAMPRAASVQPLSKRELTILAALAEEPSRTAIAAALHLSPNTVKSHLLIIYRKLGVTSREGALHRAAEFGLLTRSATATESPNPATLVPPARRP